MPSNVHPPRALTAAVVLTGAVSGAFAGLFGVGGGILLVPGLVLWVGLGQRQAHATSLAAVVPIAAGGLVGYVIEGAIDWPAAGVLMSGGAVGAVAGTRWLRAVPEDALRRVFGLFLLAAAAALLIEVPSADAASMSWAVGTTLVVVGFVSGVLAGLLGVGGGIVTVPAMVLLLGMSGAVARGTSLAVIIPTAIVGTARNVRSGTVQLGPAAVAGAAGVTAAFATSFVAVGLDPMLSSALLAALLVVVAAGLLWRRR